MEIAQSRVLLYDNRGPGVKEVSTRPGGNKALLPGNLPSLLG